MVAGVHFFPDDPPDLVGQKLLRVNLSDLAAKGATPLGYLMTVSTPKTTPEEWFAGFAVGLARDQKTYGCTLLGGDTTSTPGPISLSLTIIGHVTPGLSVHRFGASAGDGALGLQAALGKLQDPTGFLLNRYRLPQPRIGFAIGGIASAGMDVSDGLVQDLGHMCRASNLKAEIDAAAVPISDAALKAGPAWLQTRLTGGDDYELLLAVPPAREPALKAQGIPVTRIGTFHSGPPEVTVRGPGGETLAFDKGGWSHF
jgi:thiamine-monophosphate kinase